MRPSILVPFLSLTGLCSFIDPIEIKGKHFFNSITNEPFFLKGVDYQPGGSSGVCKDRDPLSDEEACARDILLFQQLGINTIRVYSVSPDLNHDKCMTLLAIAGIYLVSDVNSPLENQHLNRYEPWTSYNDFYMEHVFKIIEQFSGYNNTLAFFAGNEVVNDRASAKVAPAFLKALVRDMKSFMTKHKTRKIPVGYSAADDLSFRTSSPNYLQCQEDYISEDTAIDFYGVNSYQWCGNQNMQTSGYTILTQDYSEFSKPVFFSEYGCNEVTPREFQEVNAIYSKEMTHVFSGGLVYEFHQEENNYGLVEYDADGNVKLLGDFFALQNAFANVEVDYDEKAFSKEVQTFKSADVGFGILKQKQSSASTSTKCEASYNNINTAKELPKIKEIDQLIQTGITQTKGRYVPIVESDLATNYRIYDENENNYYEGEKIKITAHPKPGKPTSKEPIEKGGEASDSEEKKKGFFAYLFKNEGK